MIGHYIELRIEKADGHLTYFQSFGLPTMLRKGDDVSFVDGGELGCAWMSTVTKATFDCVNQNVLVECVLSNDPEDTDISSASWEEIDTDMRHAGWDVTDSAGSGSAF